MAPLFLRVVVNVEGRYALWPHTRPTPTGWRDTHFVSSRIRCLAQIGEVTRAGDAFRAGRAEAGRPAETLTGLLAAVTAGAPDAAAVVHQGHRTSFRDLDRRSSALARVLAEHGAGPGDMVGVWLRSGADAIVGRLAVLKTGAAYLPLTAGHPPGAPGAGLRLVLTEPEWTAQAHRHGAQVLAWRHRDPSGRVLVRPVRAGDPAYVTYGATPFGGLLMAHRHLVLAGRSAQTGRSGGPPGPPDQDPPAPVVPPGAAEGALWGRLLRGAEVSLDQVTGDLALPVHPAPPARWHVLDDELYSAPVGRLYVSAAWLGQGYAGHPARSAHWLVPDPSDPTGATTMLPTGRWARREADGTIRSVAEPPGHRERGGVAGERNG